MKMMTAKSLSIEAFNEAYFSPDNCLVAAVLLNHELSNDQINDLIVNGYGRWKGNKELAQKWAQIQPGPNYDHDLLNEVMDWLKALKPDCLIVQGEMTHTFALIGQCKKIYGEDFPVYAATSRRKTIETVKDGISLKTAVFEHAGFREYQLGW